MESSRRRFAARLALLALAARIALRAAFAAPPGSPRRAGAAQALRVATLAERVLKLHAQVGQGILARRAHRSLAAALRELQAATRALGMPPAPSELHERTAILALLAAQYRARASRIPTRDAAVELGERAEEIEWEARRIAQRLLQTERGTARELAAKAVEAGGLAERIARLSLWERWGIAAADGASRLDAAKSSLQADLDWLRRASPSSPAAGAELQVAENQAAFLFAAAWRRDGQEAARDIEFAVKASDNAHESLERLAALYERMAG